MSTACTHCGDPIPHNSDGGEGFCCKGCRGAYELVNGLGLTSYYDRRTIDPDVKSLRPDEDGLVIDYRSHVQKDPNGDHSLYLMVEGIHCAACVWLIETALGRQEAVTHARVNMTTRRLVVKWRAEDLNPNDIIAIVTGLGYRLVPYNPCLLNSEGERQEKELLRAMSVVGFAAANVMLFSISVWAGYTQGMMDSTRDLMHWLSALIALPAVAYSGRPFFRSAWTALRARRMNMDVPISLAVILASGMSLLQVIKGEEHAYFDSAVSLLFFLLIGRYLDMRARGRARGAAEHLLGLNAVAVTIVKPDNTKELLPPDQVKEGMIVLCAAGEQVAVDGTVMEGVSDVDTSLISGETVPEPIKPGVRVFAGTINLSAPVRIRVDATGESTLLAEIVRLMEEAESGRAKYVALADRVAHYYAPVVHLLALITFTYWMIFTAVPWQESLLHAIAVLIITCPCALALAVPVVQVVATGRLMRQGILVKSGTALERFARVDTVVFDKTGTLTLGRPELVNGQDLSHEVLSLAASLAGGSKHPLSRALCRVAPLTAVRSHIREVAGCGLEVETPNGMIRLGSRLWCGQADAAQHDGPELWLAQPGLDPIQFRFSDRLRPDAKELVDTLIAKGLNVHLLSGDQEGPVRAVATALGIENWQAACTPKDKTEFLTKLHDQGHQCLMVGDGLNDAPALAAAAVSLSPSSAVDVSQTVADSVFQGEKLRPVEEIITVSQQADRLVKQNIGVAFLYNSVTVPLAMAGYVTPLVAAIAMSSSSLVVIANALRLNRRKKS